MDSDPQRAVTECDGNPVDRRVDLRLGFVPGDEVAARDLAVGDVVRLQDPQAHRVERVMISDGRVVLELRPVGLAVSDAVRVAVAAEAVIDRLGSVGD